MTNGVNREAGRKGVAVVTGASSGIGAATVAALTEAGFEVVAGARREDKLQAVADAAGAGWRRLDVTDPASVEAFVAALHSCRLLVNNAGGAVGLDTISETDDAKWRAMFETNVLGLARMTRALLPLLRRNTMEAPGHIVNIGSIAGIEAYAGGGGYTAAKHGTNVISRTLRIELKGEPVRVTEVAPGMVETEFSLVRFDGDAVKAGRVYEGVTPLTAADVADSIVWAATRPPHVNVDQLVIRPLLQTPRS